MVLIGLLVLLVGMFLRQWRLAMIACVVLALHLSCFATAFPSAAKHESVGHLVTVTSVNVLSGNVQHDPCDC